MPLAGIEPALLAELDFEFERVYQFRHRGFSRSQGIGEVAKPAEYSGRGFPVNPRVSALIWSKDADRPIGFAPAAAWQQKRQATGATVRAPNEALRTAKHSPVIVPASTAPGPRVRTLSHRR